MGKFAALYKGVDTKRYNRPVAIKDMIGNSPGALPMHLNFFRREAEILKALESVPTVPKVYEFIHVGQTARLVMEFIPGKNLLEIMEANGNQPFPISSVIKWGKVICDLLSYMHDQSPPLIHRNVKPQHIILLENQDSIKVVDFGWARDMGRTLKERFAPKARVYTEGYAPPEQIVSRPEPRSDLFALCATLYHLATGRAPEGFYTCKELEFQLADPASPLPQDYRWFFEMIKINLSEDINDRYFSAREIKRDLEAQRVVKEIDCPKCKTVNPVRQPYCAKCAEPLTDAVLVCSICGKNNRMGCRTCEQCGNPIGRKYRDPI